MGARLNQNLYSIPDEIQIAEEKQMRLNEGRRLSKVMLLKMSDGFAHGDRTGWTGNELSCVCEAAVNTDQLVRIGELQRKIEEYKGSIVGLQSQIDRSTTWNDADQYQQDCLRTASKRSKNEYLCLLGLGLTGESGEVADHIKKHVGHGHELDSVKVAKELGDTLWYLAVLADAVGYTLTQVMSMNVQKLMKRFPNGFTSKDSIARVDAADEVPTSKTSVESPGVGFNMVPGVPQEQTEPARIRLGPDVWCEQWFDDQRKKPGYWINGARVE